MRKESEAELYKFRLELEQWLSGVTFSHLSSLLSNTKIVLLFSSLLTRFGDTPKNASHLSFVPWRAHWIPTPLSYLIVPILVTYSLP